MRLADDIDISDEAGLRLADGLRPARSTWGRQRRAAGDRARARPGVPRARLRAGAVARALVNCGDPAGQDRARSSAMIRLKRSGALMRICACRRAVWKRSATRVPAIIDDGDGGLSFTRPDRPDFSRPGRFPLTGLAHLLLKPRLHRHLLAQLMMHFFQICKDD